MLSELTRYATRHIRNGRPKGNLCKRFLPTREFVTQFKQLLKVINKKRRLPKETPRIFSFGLIRGNP